MNETVALSEEFHASSKVEEIAISKLRIDPAYQRVPNSESVDYLARNWDVIAAELILVSNRGTRKDDDVEGGLFVISGQHRMKAAHKRGVKMILARVIDLSKEENPAAREAYYRRLANVRVQDRSVDAFRAKVVEGDPESLAIVKLLKKHGTEINLQPEEDTGINAVAAVEMIYARDEGSVLNETLEVIKDAWGNITPKSASANILKGVAWFIDCHSTEVNRSRLTEKLQSLTLSQIGSRAGQMQATMGRARWMNVYFVLVDLYNEKLTQRNQLTLNTKGSRALLNKHSATHKRAGRE